MTVYTLKLLLLHFSRSSRLVFWGGAIFGKIESLSILTDISNLKVDISKINICVVKWHLLTKSSVLLSTKLVNIWFLERIFEVRNTVEMSGLNSLRNNFLPCREFYSDRRLYILLIWRTFIRLYLIWFRVSFCRKSKWQNMRPEAHPKKIPHIV